MTRPPKFKELETEIEEIRIEKEEAIKDQDFEKAASLRDKEKQTKKQLEEMLEQWRSSSEEETIKVNEDDIMGIVAKWTGVPLQRMEEAEAEKLLRMEDELRSHVSSVLS